MAMHHDAQQYIRRWLKRRKIDGLLVSQPENRRYLSGYTATDVSISESSGVLLIRADGPPFLLTDSRYQLQAEAEATGYEVKLYPRGLLAELGRMLPALAIKRLAFESHYYLYSAAEKLSALAKKLGIELVPQSGLVETLRLLKKQEELRRIKEAVLLNEAVFQEVFRTLRPGMTERQIALMIETAMRTRGADGPSFETIVASGPHAALPHAVPSHRQLEKGEPVIIDMGLKLDGYCSDMTRTVALGTPSARMVRLLRIVRKAQLAGIQALRAGIAGKEVDRAARSVIEQEGHGGNFGHGLGHGVGLAVHEAPALNRRNRKHLRAGMVVTIEPGIYIAGWGGIRLENMAVVTEAGCEVLNRDATFLDL